MSWNNIIPAELLLDTSKVKKPVEIENPLVTIPDNLVTDCLISYKFEGAPSVIAGQEDHPAFAEVRRILERQGYIDIPPYPCWNGDRVLKRFKFNNFQLEVGDTFYCAAAWSTKITLSNQHEKRL